MKKILLRTALAITFSTTILYAGAQVTYSLEDNNQISMIVNEDDPNGSTGPYPISGVTDGQILVAMDARPNSSLYALGYDYTGGLAQLYRIVNSNGGYVANAIAPATSGLSLTEDNTVSDFSFTPASNKKIRLTDAKNNSYIIDVNNGNITDIGNDLFTGANGLTVNGTSDGSELTVFPNPVITTAHVVLPQTTTHALSVYVVNMNGDIVGAYEYGSGIYKFDIDMSVLPPGLYSVRVSQRGMSSENLKIVKN